MIRVAFTLIGGRNWTGGYNYLLNLVRALAKHSPESITPVMFFGADTDTADAAPFTAIPGVETVRTPVFNEARRTGQLLRALILGRDAEVQAQFARHRIDGVFESAQFHGWRAAQPAIAWIPDFQHRFLPHLFSRGGYWKRELGFRAQVFSGRQIMLSSEESREACQRFYPSTRSRAHVVHFAVPTAPPITRSEARAIAQSYGLHGRYVFMPNQFWQHKNHCLVIDALALLRNRGHTDIVVAASGKQLDPRKPSHFAELMAHAETLGVRKQFRPLGLVPYSHLAPLMRAADALLNPSLFEGWSTTVEEARAQGVPMILSDLAVHREQAGNVARYFDRTSAASLAEALLATPPAASVDETALIQTSDIRVKAFAHAFVSLVQSTVSPRWTRSRSP
ncbi:MAG: glycosyltransferase family 4 protein [Burkholderiales bacterium]|nr:glycosyltransferase family 4 protein [Burkholderiales bacterium]